MKAEKTDKKQLTFKQKLFLYFYKTRQYIYNDWFKTKADFNNLTDTFWFYLLLFSILLFLLQQVTLFLKVDISEDHLYSLSIAVGGVIGASIAIMFSFSTFILQSTADLFSTQYLNKFVRDKKEKLFFWLLVILTISAFLVPILVKYSALEVLLTILFAAFYLIYVLYKELRKRINPETTLTRIKNDAVKHLKKVNRTLKKHADIQNKIFDYKAETKDLSLAMQYKTNPTWNVVALENIKFLYEIGLRLLSKNEINSFNLTLRYIHDIYLEHLNLRNGHLIRTPASFWGTYTCDDEGFTSRVLEYLESISNRIIQEKRKENIYFLLSIYENLLNNSLAIKFADKNFAAQGENPLLTLILAYYIGLIEKLVQSKENDWIWESIKSVSRVSNLLLQSGYNYFTCSQINQVINKIIPACLATKQEAFLKEILNIYLNQIRIAWNKYDNDEIFWKDLFKELKKTSLVLSLSSDVNLSLSELYIGFHAWLVAIINSIFEIKDKDEQKKALEAYTGLLGRWSDFLLDFARDTGLENKQMGLPIIQSVENNLRIIYGIHEKFKIDLSQLYRTQFNTLSWYFEKTEKVDGSFLFNLEKVQETLLREIRDNLSEKVFDVGNVIGLYVRLVQQHFDKVSLGYGYNHPRVIEKLLHLGLILHKYKKNTDKLVELIESLNAKYLILNKEYFDLRKKESNLMGPNEYQLCKEIHDLGEDLFSYNSGVIMDIKQILKEEITKEMWDEFRSKIKSCEGVEYKTVRRF